MKQQIPRGLYDEALSTYESLRPIMETRRYVIYDLPQDDWSHLLHMARSHLEAQISGGVNENGHVTRCRRYLKQLAQIEESQ